MKGAQQPEPSPASAAAAPQQTTSSSSNSTSSSGGKFSDSFDTWQATTVGNILNVTLDVKFPNLSVS